MHELMMRFSSLLESHGQLSLAAAATVQPGMRLTLQDGRALIVTRSAFTDTNFDVLISDVAVNVASFKSDLPYDEAFQMIRQFLDLPEFH